MARRSKESAERARQVLEKSNEDIGRDLAKRHRDIIEQAACRKAGIDALYSCPNALLEPRGSIVARRLVDFMTEVYLDEALKFGPNAPFWLAVWLALRGEFERAGRTLRKCPGFDDVLAADYRRESGRAKMRATKLDKQIERIKAWAEIGYEIRDKERSPRMNVSALAREIAQRTGDSVNSIRLELPKINLDPGSWPEPVKPRARKKTNKKLRTFGTLRR